MYVSLFRNLFFVTMLVGLRYGIHIIIIIVSSISSSSSSTDPVGRALTFRRLTSTIVDVPHR